MRRSLSQPGSPPGTAQSPLRVLQAFRFAPTEPEHINRLLTWAELPAAGRILDLGSGNGCIAAQMRAQRPDLTFCLVDKDQLALDSAGSEWQTHCTDICSVPEPDNAFDAVICFYAMGYVSQVDFFHEVARLARVAAPVFIVDMVPIHHADRALSLFGYAIRDRASVESQAESVGLKLDFYMEPTDDGTWGESQFPGYFHIFFGDLRPAIWRFMKA